MPGVPARGAPGLLVEHPHELLLVQVDHPQHLGVRLPEAGKEGKY